MIPVIFNLRTFIFLSFGFIIFTVVGTLTHELGHCTAAKWLGYETSIHYGYMNYYDAENDSFLRATYRNYAPQIKHHIEFPGQDKFDEVNKKREPHRFWISLGGPLQTMLTGTIGLVFLFAYRKRYMNRESLSFGQWLLIFIALFWLREVANLVTGLGTLIITGKPSYRNDETKLDWHLGLPVWTLETITAAIGLLVLAWVVFKIIPTKQRFTFISAGLFGGITGYILWLKMLGPVVMP